MVNIMNQLFSLSPVKNWTKFVSTNANLSYVDGFAIFTAAKDAKVILGRDVKAPDRMVKSEDPIWGMSGGGQWAKMVVWYGTHTKTILKFKVQINSQTMALDLMQRVAFQWGASSVTPLIGNIVEITPDIEGMSLDIIFFSF